MQQWVDLSLFLLSALWVYGSIWVKGNSFTVRDTSGGPKVLNSWLNSIGNLLNIIPKWQLWYSLHFQYRGLKCKSRKSRNTWSNRQIWPESTQWRGQRLIEFWQDTGHSRHPLPTTQENTLHMDITRWPIPKSDWLYSLQPKEKKLYTVSKNNTGSRLWLRS